MSAHPPACSHRASALWYPQPHRDTSALAGRSGDKVWVPQAADPTRLWSVSCSVPGLEVLTVALPTKEAGCCMWHEQGALSLYLFSFWVIKSQKFFGDFKLCMLEFTKTAFLRQLLEIVFTSEVALLRATILHCHLACAILPSQLQSIPCSQISRCDLFRATCQMFSCRRVTRKMSGSPYIIHYRKSACILLEAEKHFVPCTFISFSRFYK